MPPSKDLVVENYNVAADLGWNQNYSHWLSCGKSGGFFWLTIDWRLWSHCLSHLYVILKCSSAQSDQVCFLLALDAEQCRKKKVTVFSVLATTSIVCFIEKSNLSLFTKNERGAWEMWRAVYQAIRVSASHQKLSGFPNSIRESR